MEPQENSRHDLSEKVLDSATNIAVVEGGSSVATSPIAVRRDFRFWLVFLAIGISTVITALELSAVSTALPDIIHDLNGTTFVWVGSAYTLSATAFIPLSGGLSQIFGRRLVILGSLLIMAIGSALCGAASSMNFLIAARTVQGLGGGGIAATTAIIISDLVPLKERGVFNGLIGIAWAVSSGVGPLVGGGLAQTGEWRWLFYLNIPICGAAAALFVLFLRVPTPPGSWSEKFARVDWLGNALVIAATTSCCIALTWSGIEHAWSSVSVLVPLILGLFGLVAFITYEAFIPKYPVVPFSLMSTITGVSGYLQTFILPIIMLGMIYYVPVYFQACKGASPIATGVDQLPFAFVQAPVGILAGASVTKSGKYRPQFWLSWALVMVGTGLYTTLDENSPRSQSVGFLAIVALGTGILVTTTYFPVLAPLSISNNGLALAYFMFLRNFAQVWGVTIGGTILQNELKKRLPAEFLSQFPGGTAIAYATIPLISQLPDQLKMQVRAAFADSLRVVWFVLLGVAGLGFLCSLPMKQLRLHTEVDQDWALQDNGVRAPREENEG
ncbi:iron permease [Amylostereum chailletii]|nr:iron permease [Amylostereum chailletii]